MTGQFGIPKTDSTTMCERADIELVDNFQNKTDTYLKSLHLKKLANEAFDLNDSTANVNYQTTLPSQTFCYNPFYRDRQFWFTQFNTCANSTSLTTAPLEIAFDYVPHYDTGWPTSSEDVDMCAKATAGNFNTISGGVSTIASIRRDWSSRDDDLDNQTGTGYHKTAFDRYIIFWDNVYSSVISGSATNLTGTNYVDYSIDDPYGGYLSAYPFTSTTTIHIRTLAGFHTTRYGANVPSAGLSSPALGISTQTATILWWASYRSAIANPTSYPSKTRTLTTAYMIFQINGTDMKYLNTYMIADTTGGSFTIEYSTDNITYFFMTQIYNSTTNYYHQAILAGTTNTFYIKLTLAGSAGTSCSVSRFAGEGI